MGSHQIIDLVGKYPGPLFAVITRSKEVERRDRTIFIHPWQAFGQVGMVCIIEKNHWAIERNKYTPGLVVRAPHLHVGCIRGVAGIYLVEQQQT